MIVIARVAPILIGYVGVYTSTMHMFGQGFAIQMRMALQFGSTPIEL